MASLPFTLPWAVDQSAEGLVENLNTQAENTVTGYLIMARHLIEWIGRVSDVEFALGRLAKRLSTGSVRLARMILLQYHKTAWSRLLPCRSG